VVVFNYFKLISNYSRFPKNLAAKKMSQRKTVQSFQSRENG